MTTFYCKFVAKFMDERILKIGQHLTKLLLLLFILLMNENYHWSFLDSQCSRNLAWSVYYSSIDTINYRILKYVKHET